MKLRTHLVLLVLAAVLPLLAFTAVMGAIFWREQRDAYDERFLERVRALAIALDREMGGHARALRVLGQSTALQAGDLRGFYERVQRVRTEQPAWNAVLLTDPAGAPLINTGLPFGAPQPRPAVDDALITEVVTTGRPMVSPLVWDAARGEYMTAIIVPVRRVGAAGYALIASLAPRVWLDLLARYPIVPGATMTLLDQHGIIVARTLNSDRWVGKPPSPALAAEARKSPEAAYRNIGLEGQRFYTAHSRVPISGWTLATGVPADQVEAALRGSALALAAAATLVAVAAVGLALVFARRIARPVTELARSVGRFGAADEPPAIATVRAPAVDEVTEVARAFDEAAARLRARETALRESQERFREIAAARAHALENEKTARAEAEAANQMKDEFLAVLSHELRTPINAVFGWARLLRTAKGEEQTLEHGLAVIERNAAAQVKLIEDLLDVSRIISGKMRFDVRPVDVAAAVESALDSVRQAAEMKDIRLASVLDPRAGTVVGDPDRLRQLVWNLLSNAIKFTPKGGRVQVRLTRTGSRVEIVVTDTGVGITSEFLPHIFERFRQGDSTSTRQHGGLGLGLALVKHIVELHGGIVRAESAGEGLGATFTVQLPVALATTSDATGTSTTPAALPAVSLEGLRVLVVDDDRDTLDLFARVLDETGAELRTATSSEEAMTVFGQWRPTLLISDIEMPDEDGYTLIRRVRALDPSQGGDIPAVAVTAYGRVEDRVKLLGAGFNMHLPKPVEPAELLVVLAILARRATTDGAP
ncbi:MAG TPA: ATP-binding protein [Methylomirabilota bacterium]|nr:ATP-binding protein [Methylomirabilota bacterium]